MEQRIFHGNLTPQQMGAALVARFNRGGLRAQQFSHGDQLIVQISTRERPASGGPTAMAVTLHKVEDGVSVQIGRQAWLGVAASLGTTAISTLRNPFNILGRLDDLAQDIENLQLADQVWETIHSIANAAGASYELSERLRRAVCEYCQTANPVGEPSCIACGAPLGRAQPRTCPNCGFVIQVGESTCPNCKQRV